MTNKLGFHGSLTPSRFLENKLFDSSDHVTEGINFDNVRLVCECDVQYDNISVEVSGDNVPNPIMEFTKTTFRSRFCGTFCAASTSVRRRCRSTVSRSASRVAT